MTTPERVAGPAFALAISQHIDRPVPEAGTGPYQVDVHLSGAVTVWFTEGGLTRGLVRLEHDSATAKNLRGLLLALKAGAIA